MSYTIKQIRNRVRKYPAPALLAWLAVRCCETEDAGIQTLRKWRTWELLLLMRWAMEEGGKSADQRPVNDDVLAKLSNMFHLLESDSGHFDGPPGAGVGRFLLSMSHQQFYLQEGLTSEDLARTWNIVGKAAWDGLWRSAMGEISLAQFLTVMMCLVVELKSREGRADFDSTILENKGISADLLRRALLPISMGFRDMQAYLKARPARVNDLDLHPFEPSPLLRYPVMRMRGDRFMLYSRRLLEEAIRLIPWRVLRDQQDQALLRRYAVRFEKHIEQSLDEAGLRFVGEKALQDAFGAGKAVDFAVILNDVTLLIEVKSADLSSIGKATARPDTLRRDLKTSVLKGIAQGLSLTHTIRSRPGVMPDISRNKTYVLVVTYRDLNLMSSSQFWKSYAEDGVAKHLESEGVPLSTIPADRVFVCSAREFDTLMAALREQRLTFEDFLERAAFGNSNPTTTRHRLSMFLSAEEHPSQMLPHLRASVEMMGREGIRITEEEHAVSQRGPQSPGRA